MWRIRHVHSLPIEIFHILLSAHGIHSTLRRSIWSLLRSVPRLLSCQCCWKHLSVTWVHCFRDSQGCHGADPNQNPNIYRSARVRTRVINFSLAIYLILSVYPWIMKFSWSFYLSSSEEAKSLALLSPPRRCHIWTAHSKRLSSVRLNKNTVAICMFCYVCYILLHFVTLSAPALP